MKLMEQQCSLLLKNQKKQFLIFQKIQNLQQKKWYILHSESKGNYLPHNEVKFLTSSLESSLCNYSDAYILVTGNINVTGGDNNTKVAFKNCAQFKNCRTEINETVDEAVHINIAMPIYNLIEYSDNYSDTSGSLWQFKRDEQPVDNNGACINFTADILHHLNTNQILLVILLQVKHIEKKKV